MAMLTMSGEVNTVGSILSDAGMTVLIGLVVVFAVLLLLTAIIKLFGKAMSGTAKTETQASVAPAVAPSVAAPIVGNTAPVTTEPQVENGIPEETVAVISAAVASVAPMGTQYAVRSIRRA